MIANANNLDSGTFDSGTFRVKPVGSYRLGMDASHNPANAQHLNGVVRGQPQPNGHSYHPVHRLGADRDPAPHGAPDTPDAVNEYPSTQAAGNPGTIPQGPHPGVPGDYAGLPRGRGQPHRLFGTACGADAHPIRLVPGPGTDLVQQAGRPDRVVGEDIFFCALFINLHRRSIGLEIPLAGPGGNGSSDTPYTDNGVRLHLDPTKNDHDPVNGPPAARQPDHDAVDDAADDRLFLFDFPQWPGLILDSFQPHWYRNTILYNRVDSFVPAVPQSSHGPRASRSTRTGTGRGV